MAKYRSRTLRWKAVASDDVAGYKVYWSKGEKVTYDSESVCVQKVTKITIPDDLAGFAPSPGLFMFGITAIDQWGNESDLTTLKEPFHFTAPPEPSALWVQPIAVPSAPEFLRLDAIERSAKGAGGLAPAEEEDLLDGLEDIEDAPFQFGPKAKEDPDPPPLKYYDDLGFRKL